MPPATVHRTTYSECEGDSQAPKATSVSTAAVPAGAECCVALLPTERAKQVEEQVRRLGPQQDC